MRDTGQPLAAVARAPYHTTLWTWAHAVGQDRREALIRAGERISAASAIAVGFHEPKRLADLVREHDDAIGVTESPGDAVKNQLSILALVEETNRIARRDAAAEQLALPEVVE